MSAQASGKKIFAAAAALFDGQGSMGNGSAQADYALVMTHLRAREYDKAMAAVDRLEKKQPDSALAANLRGSVLAAKGVDPVALVGGSVLLLFLVGVLADGPKKHKDFTYSDQVKGMLQSYGGNPPPEVEPPEELREENQP